MELEVEGPVFDPVSMLEGLFLVGPRCDAVPCKEGMVANGVERVGCGVEPHWCKGGALAAARRLLLGPDAPRRLEAGGYVAPIPPL